MDLRNVVKCEPLADYPRPCPVLLIVDFLVAVNIPAVVDSVLAEELSHVAECVPADSDKLPPVVESPFAEELPLAGGLQLAEELPFVGG